MFLVSVFLSWLRWFQLKQRPFSLCFGFSMWVCCKCCHSLYTVELPSCSRAPKASLQQVSDMKHAGFGILQKSLRKTKKSLGFDAGFRWGKMLKITKWKVITKKSSFYHKLLLEMPGWETEVAGKVCWKWLHSVLPLLPLDISVLKTGEWWAFELSTAGGCCGPLG